MNLADEPHALFHSDMEQKPTVVPTKLHDQHHLTLLGSPSLHLSRCYCQHISETGGGPSLNLKQLAPWSQCGIKTEAAGAAVIKNNDNPNSIWNQKHNIENLHICKYTQKNSCALHHNILQENCQLCARGKPMGVWWTAVRGFKGIQDLNAGTFYGRKNHFSWFFKESPCTT